MSDNIDSSDTASDTASPSAFRGLCSTSKPTRHDYAAVVTEINAAEIVIEGSIFELGPYVPIIHMAYLKHPIDASAFKFKAEKPKISRRVGIRE